MTILEIHVYSTTVGILTLEKFYWNVHVLKNWRLPIKVVAKYYLIINNRKIKINNNLREMLMSFIIKLFVYLFLNYLLLNYY